MRPYSTKRRQNPCFGNSLPSIFVPQLILYILTRFDAQPVACFYRYILSLDFNITIRRFNRNTLEGIKIHGAQRRLDRDVTVVTTTRNLIEPISVGQFESTSEIR